MWPRAENSHQNNLREVGLGAGWNLVRQNESNEEELGKRTTDHKEQTSEVDKRTSELASDLKQKGCPSLLCQSSDCFVEEEI
ncbi:hypothetical protein U1Q18_049027 [Sarracenia purpurea var. burkii]